MIGDWDAPIPWHFETPSGTLDLNTPTGYRYLLEASGCDGGIDLRVTEDNVPQGDGEIPHSAFTSGYKIRLLLSLRVAQAVDAESPPACDADLTMMLDTLGLHINEILNRSLQPGVFQRLWWHPPGHAERMLDNIRLLERPVVARTEAEPTTVAFAVFSEFPYVKSRADVTTSFTNGETATILNGGNCPYFPVLKVYGTGSSYPITITNNTVLDDSGNPLVIVYDDSLPGAVAIPGGHYAEVNTFTNTVYEDGSGANLKAGIDILQSDFWTIPPGGASITITGATMDVISADSWR